MTTQPRIALDDLTSDALDALYDQLDALRERRTKRSHLLQELKRDNFALRMDIVALLEGFTVSEVQPGEINRAARAEALMTELEAARDRALGLADRLEEFAENALRTDDRKLYAAIAADIRTRLAP
ncbi:hypothetical protein ACH4MJ_04290 [Streptomyces anulatus]